MGLEVVPVKVGFDVFKGEMFMAIDGEDPMTDGYWSEEDMPQLYVLAQDIVDNDSYSELETDD